MCTALSLHGRRHLFGRNLDLEYRYREQVVITPRKYPFLFRCGYRLPSHYAMIGMATVSTDYPLYYEATNEKGLSMAGLSFPHSATYHPKCAGKDNLAPYELIPWILGQCDTVSRARQLLERLHVWALPFSREFPLTPLHWIIADEESCITVEPMADGLHVYENQVRVLTNEPAFPYHMQRLQDFMHLQPQQPENRFVSLPLKPYSNGMGAMGLPGDFSSVSRFVKAVYVKEHSESQNSDVSQFFHILGSVAMPAGAVRVNSSSELTRYSCCCDTRNGTYYYTTYDNSRPRAVRMQAVPLNEQNLATFDLMHQPDIFYQN